MMILIFLLAFIVAVFLYLRFNPQFGGSVTAEHKDYYADSEYWDGKKFDNLTETSFDINIRRLPRLIKNQFTNTKARRPKNPIPVVKFDAATFESQPQKPKFIWYGHSVLLLQINGKNLLIDPMFGGDTTPIAPVPSKRFSRNTLAIIDELPPIDAILLTHDHYDHLDYHSIQQLKTKVHTFYVALGVARHLERWGIPNRKITEFNWWQSITLHNIKITFTPSRHFSGRGLTDRAKTLWGGWVFESPQHCIYWSGDGGYGNHFKTIASKFSPFDWAFIECGQYNENWHPIHMYPEESVQAAIDVKAPISIPVHWGGFTLALHTWKEPVERFVAAAQQKNIRTCTPQIGEIVILGEEPKANNWYVDLE